MSTNGDKGGTQRQGGPQGGQRTGTTTPPGRGDQETSRELLWPEQGSRQPPAGETGRSPTEQQRRQRERSKS